MAELEKKREAERRLALLALTGEQPEPNGSCLDAEELAALVEGRLATEQVQPCLYHLAGCEHCYVLWRQLDEEWQERTGKTNRNTLRRLVSRPRFLAAAGSLLAAAASIAVFLNITTQIDRHTLMRLPEQPAREQVLTAPSEESIDKAVAEKALAPPPPPASTSPSQTLQTEEQTVAPATATETKKTQAPTRTEGTTLEARDTDVPAQPPGSGEKRGEGVAMQAPADSAGPVDENAPANTDMMMDKKEQEAMGLPKKSASAFNATPQAALRAVEATAPLPAPVTGSGPLTLADWQNRIREGCQGRPGPELFEAIIRQGNQLARESAMLTEEERQQIKRILAELGERQPPAHQCRTLLDILAQGAHGQAR